MVQAPTPKHIPAYLQSFLLVGLLELIFAGSLVCKTSNPQPHPEENCKRSWEGVRRQRR